MSVEMRMIFSFYVWLNKYNGAWWWCRMCKNQRKALQVAFRKRIGKSKSFRCCFVSTKCFRCAQRKATECRKLTTMLDFRGFAKFRWEEFWVHSFATPSALNFASPQTPPFQCFEIYYLTIFCKERERVGNVQFMSSWRCKFTEASWGPANILTIPLGCLA